MDIQPASDPVFVFSCFLRKLGIYSGMDGIVIADNTARDRVSTRAVIINLRSNFHKQGAIATLKRELARQMLANTVRACFPVITINVTQLSTTSCLQCTSSQLGQLTSFKSPTGR
jgi:hypothetical protein